MLGQSDEAESHVAVLTRKLLVIIFPSKLVQQDPEKRCWKLKVSPNNETLFDPIIIIMLELKVYGPFDVISPSLENFSSLVPFFFNSQDFTFKNQ